MIEGEDEDEGRGGRGRGRGREGRSRGGRVVRVVLPAHQHECPECHLRAASDVTVVESYDRHFPWCSKYNKEIHWEVGVVTDVAKEELQLQYEKMKVLKERLKLYGETTSGKKRELVVRLKSVMDAPPPESGVGSWYHFNRKQTAAASEKFCNDYNIMVESGYVTICTAYTFNIQHIHINRSSKMDLYELVYFCRPKQHANQLGLCIIEYMHSTLTYTITMTHMRPCVHVQQMAVKVKHQFVSRMRPRACISALRKYIKQLAYSMSDNASDTYTGEV